MKNPSCAPGFTQVEVLVVLALAALLAGLVYPTYTHSFVRMRRLEGETALIEAMQKQELYRARHGSYVAFSADAPAPPGLGVHWWSGEAPASSAYELDASACAGEQVADCVVLRARPGTARVNGRVRDPDCGVLTLDSRGRQAASGPEPKCWP